MTSQPAGPRHARIAETLQGIVGRVLRIEPRDLDIEAPFLELGADSLALVEALRGIQEAFGAKLTIRQLFEQLPTISVLASYLEQTVPAEALPVVAAVQAAVQAPVVMAAPVVVAPHPPAPSPIPSLPAGRGGEVSPIAPALAPLAPLPASASGLERVFGMQIQAFNQLVAQQLQMMGGRVAVAPAPTPQSPHPPAPSPAPPPSLPGRGGDQMAADNLKPVLPTFLGKAAKGAELGERQRKHLDALVERYCRKTAKSKELTQRYRPWLADSRATVGFRPQVKEMLYPLARARSRGSRLWDVDGNEYIDITMGMGVHLFGHAPEFLQPTIESQIHEGFELGPRSAHSGEAAQLFCELTGMERATFTNSGTEAVMTAIRLARARTGRTRIAMFANSYHGHSDGTLAQSREVDGEIRSFPVAPGIPPRVAEEVMVLEYGSDHSLEILRRHAHELAAIIVEPIQSRRPEIQPRAFLHELRRLTTESGSALIFDEMICGFRLHLGGGQAHFGVRADLATYGKIVGGGLPIGVVAGSAEYMDGIDGGTWQYGDDSRPERDTTFFGGTFCQFPLSMAAARVVLQYLKDQGPGLQETLNARTARFAARLNQWLEEEQVPIRISSAHSLFRFQSTSNMELLYYHLVDKGIYVWEWRNCFLSTAHTDADLDAIVHAIQESVQELRQGGFLPEKPPLATPPPPEPGAGEKVGTWERKGFKPAIAPMSEAGAAGSSARTTGASASAVPGLDPHREVLFSLYFFGNYSAEFQSGKYDLILDSARFADRAGLSGVWFPERHFHQFGGLSPNPSVLAAALARETERIALRAGSVVLPLHHPVRVAEEWALVDNLSGGRVGLSYASGWHPNDFALAPESYGNHRELMFERAETVRRLWKGEAVRLRDGAGSEVDLRIYPLPARRDLPIWITIVNNPDTYRRAGEMGAGVLTNLMGQTLDALAANLAIYREALAAAGHPPSAGHVTLLLHTFLGPDAGQAIDTARAPFHRYLHSSLGLVKNALASEGQAVDFDNLSPEDFEYMLELAYQRYVRTSALIGSPESVAPIVASLHDLGVDEIACLVDFGVDPALVGESLPSIAALQQRFRERRPARTGEERLRVPLTEAQSDLWTVAQLGKAASLAYLEAGVLEMRGPLDAGLLRRALQTTVDRHEALRSVVPALFGSEAPDQEILAELILDVPLVDLSALPMARREAETRAWLDAESRRPFDLARGPLVRATLLRLDPRVHQLYFCVHHIVADGLSIAIAMTEALAVYEAGRAGRRAVLSTPYQPREYAAWLLGEGAATPEDEAHWLTEFSGELPVFEPPADRPRPPVRTFRGDRRRHVLGVDRLRGLREASRRNGATLFIGLLSAWTALLHRWTGQDDVIVGAPTVYRPLEGGDRLVAHSAHLLPYRSRLAATAGEEPTFGQHVAALRRSVFGAHEHGAYPVERLLRRLDLPRDPSRAPLINSVINIDPGAGITRAGGLELIERSPVISHAKFDVALHVLEAGGDLILYFDFLRDLFDPATMDRLAAYLQTLVDGVIADPARPLGDLPLLSAAELRQVVTDWNRTGTDYPRDQSIPALFDAAAALDPRAPAVLWTGPAGEESLSYGELRARADRLAARLRAQGVGPDVRVALEMERSAELVVAMLAVLKAGGAYVPLDPSDPADRRAFVLEDSGALLLPVLAMEADDGPAAPPSAPPDPLQLAYVIYTSGSTGRPKGVAVPHRAVVRLCVNTDYARLGPHDRVAHVSNTAFDAATFEVWGALLNGAPLVVIPRETAVIPGRLARAVRERGISAMFLTATLFGEVVREEPDALAGVRWMMYGGEAAAPERVQEVRAAMDASGAGADRHVVNGYGPTESTTFALTHAVEMGDRVGRSVPIGRPIANTRAWVVDRLLRPVAPGTPGELILGGDGLARGYLGRPELTAERFVPNPFEDGERVYRTGDLVRARPDGVVEFLGRTDDQVKVRGFRVELGEIETAAGLHPAVREVVVLAPAGPAGRRLVAFVALEPGIGLADPAADLRAFVRERLPEWMVPSTVAILDALPRTPSGKLDRRALAPRAANLDGGADAAPATFEAPRNPAEETVAAAWAEVLQRDRVGIHDDFFALGGHSLLAGRILSRLSEGLGVELTLSDFFQEPTVAGLARLAMEARWTGAGTMPPPLIPTRRAPSLPLSFAQERLWLLDQLQPGSGGASSSLAARLSGRLSVSALTRALAEIVRRHEVLRARFPGGADGPVQRIDPYTPPPLPVADLAGLPEEVREDELRRLRLAEAGRPFDLAHGPLVRATLLRLGSGAPGEEHVLLINLHNAICDDWSAEEVLPAELAALYRAFVAGRSSPLPELPVQYADFAEWQRQSLPPEAREARLSWWRKRLGAEPVLVLPADHPHARPRPRVPSGCGASREIVLPSTVLEGLRDFGRREGATLFMVLLAGLQTLLHRVSGQDRINIGTPVANRPRTEVEPLIGAFANTLVLSGDLAGNPTVRELLDRVRELTLGAFDQQDVPLDKLFAAVPRRRDPGRHPLFQVHFVLRDGRTSRIDLPGVTLSRLRPLVEPLAGRARQELAFSMVEEQEELRIRLGYSPDLFEASRIERMLAGLGSLLAALGEDPERRIADLPLADAALGDDGPLTFSRALMAAS